MPILDRFQMPLAEAMMTQRAIRRVTAEPIEDALLLQIIELGTKAPNSKNEQAWEFIVLKDPAVKAKIGKQNRFLWRLARGMVERKTKRDPKFAKLFRATDWGVEHFEAYPAMIVGCFRGPRLGWPVILASSLYGSIFPAVQNIMLAARAVGLGANLTTMPLWNNCKSRRILGLPRSVTPCVLITLGWPQGKYGPTTRKPVGDVVSRDRYGNRPWSGKTASQIEGSASGSSNA